MNEMEAEIAKLSQDLDRLGLELAMSQEALESIEIDIILLKAELDYFAEGW